MNKITCKNHYICYTCKEEFIKGITDKEAEEQFKKEFPNHERQINDIILCDVCYKKITKRGYLKENE